MLLPQSTAVATIIPVSQSRSVSAAAGAAVPGDTDSDSDSATAPGFGLFDEDVDPSAVAIGGSVVAIAQGIASQTSDHDAGSVTASGFASTDLTLLPSSSTAAATGASLFDFTFTLEVPGAFTLTGSVDTQAIVTGGASIPSLTSDLVLEDLTHSLVLFQTLTDDESFAVGGALAAGTYRL